MRSGRLEISVAHTGGSEVPKVTKAGAPKPQPAKENKILEKKEENRGTLRWRARKKFLDQRQGVRECSVGDMMFVHIPAVKPGHGRKYHRPWTGLYKITQKLSPGDYRILLGKGILTVAHVNRLKPAVGIDPEVELRKRNSEGVAQDSERPGGVKQEEPQWEVFTPDVSIEEAQVGLRERMRPSREVEDSEETEGAPVTPGGTREEGEGRDSPGKRTSSPTTPERSPVRSPTSPVIDPILPPWL